jgi:predicted metal-dependent peptidase
MPRNLQKFIDDTSSGKFPRSDIQMEGYSEIYKAILADLIYECEKSENEWGTASGSNEVIRKIKKKKYPWDVVLRNILHTKVTEITAGFRYRTYMKPNRRHHDPNIIFPAYVDYKRKINLAIILDISGSMGYLVNRMYAVIKSIVDINDLEINCTILETAYGVQRVIENFDFNAKELESNDGGGTSMPSGWHYLIDHGMDNRMDLIVCMTDTYTDWEPLLVEKSVVLGSESVKPDECPYVYFPVIFDQVDFSSLYDLEDY